MSCANAPAINLQIFINETPCLDVSLCLSRRPIFMSNQKEFDLKNKSSKSF